MARATRQRRRARSPVGRTTQQRSVSNTTSFKQVSKREKFNKERAVDRVAWRRCLSSASMTSPGTAR